LNNVSFYEQTSQAFPLQEHLVLQTMPGVGIIPVARGLAALANWKESIRLTVPSGEIQGFPGQSLNISNGAAALRRQSKR